MCNAPTRTSKHTDFTWETWSSSAQQSIPKPNSELNIHWHPRPPDPLSLKPKSDLALSLSTYPLVSLADSTTLSTKVTSSRTSSDSPHNRTSRQTRMQQQRTPPLGPHHRADRGDPWIPRIGEQQTARRTTMMTTTNHRDPRQRLSYHHNHRNPRQRLSHHNPPQNFVPTTGGAAQIFTPRHPQTEESPPQAATPKMSLHHNHPYQSRSRGDIENTHTRRYQPPCGSNPPNTHYPLRKIRNPRKPRKSKNSRRPVDNHGQPRVSIAPRGSLHLSSRTPSKSSDTTDTIAAKLKHHHLRKRCQRKFAPNHWNPVKRDAIPSNSEHHEKGSTATDNL